MRIESFSTASGQGIRLSGDNDRVITIEAPVVLEILEDTERTEGAVARIAAGYDAVASQPGSVSASATIHYAGTQYALTDTWTQDGESVRIDRSLAATSQAGTPAIRLFLEAEAGTGNAGFDDMRLFAPPALYDLNDIDGDGVEDYLDTRELLYRDDRLTGLAVLAYDPETGTGYALTREDPPEYDEIPVRVPRQQNMVQKTDIGALGLMPGERNETRLVAAYPFAERSRSHALTAEGREPWGAFWPVDSNGTTLEVSYAFQLFSDPTPVGCLWSLWNQRIQLLSPRPVELTASLADITQLRVEALMPYYAELSGPTPTPAGFVTNCHPQNGKQLENIIQYGFTGQNVLNAHHILANADALADPEARSKALKVIDFFASRAAESDYGLTNTLFDLDTGRPGNWWSGLLLPLAYAEEGQDLEKLMGPVYEHMKYAIEPLRTLDGTYLRCMAEEHGALLRAYEAEKARGFDHASWLHVATKFGEFLLAAQEEDGSWRRAYGFDACGITEPRAWFGETELNQKSSTATAVPVLVTLARLTGEDRWMAAARAAERFTSKHFVDGMKFNGGIHDSIYSRAQLVDSESILFAMRASLTVWQQTADRSALDSAIDAAKILSTWIYLWDVPLPPSSTLAQYGFRSTGWSACDTCGAGYIHPYEIHAVPDLFELAIASGDKTLAFIAELVLLGSSETVATLDKDWGYARPGLQEEGLLVSWWLIDDPMFAGTGFGGRGKGEGNKTCLPWISAVGIDAYDELIRRFGTADLRTHWASLSSLGGSVITK